jgi:hypothetical protein
MGHDYEFTLTLVLQLLLYHMCDIICLSVQIRLNDCETLKFFSVSGLFALKVKL